MQALRERVATLPVDESLAYVVTLDEIMGKGVLIKSFFPDGQPHHCIGIPDVDLEQADPIINAAALIVFRKPLRRQEDKKT